ncbi:polyphenol oxidase family protein [Demequina sp. NBRC 110057]|uniref:polyphenol oxidase family protein n=1 Tax=Demequina sp. NBRC 110057 TaxID=1570346 RepID=UPI000A048442|nr:polyphenol oxidase family protein [Demequina sp. NBRC 110057]
MIDAGLPVRAFFTTRDGGASQDPYGSLNVAVHVGDDPAAVDDNRRRVSRAAGADVTFLTAEHGIRVAHISAPLASAPPADVLVTTTPGVALGTIAADCLPILLHDASTDAVAAVHVGRPGLFAGAIDAAWAALLDARAAEAGPHAIRAAIGPAICGRCYEVPEDLREEVARRHPAARAVTSWGTPALDLPRAAEARLGELGAREIVRIPVCTREDARLYSYRRDGVTGRHAGVIVHP